MGNEMLKSMQLFVKIVIPIQLLSQKSHDIQIHFSNVHHYTVLNMCGINFHFQYSSYIIKFQ
jgi:hypothetical protein